MTAGSGSGRWLDCFVERPIDSLCRITGARSREYTPCARAVGRAGISRGRRARGLVAAAAIRRAHSDGAEGLANKPRERKARLAPLRGIAVGAPRSSRRAPRARAFVVISFASADGACLRKRSQSARNNYSNDEL